MERTEMQQQALTNARAGQSVMNYSAIFRGFAEKGIEDIRPRENVLTYNAWRALGRQVRRGEHGVSVCTWVALTKKDDEGNAQAIGRKPRMTTVFHISQTDPIGDAKANTEPRPAVRIDGDYSEEFTRIA